MKRVFVLLFASILSASEIENLLSQSYNELFDLKFQQNISDKNYNSLSWLSPVMLSYEKSWSNQIGDDYDSQERFSVSIDQPIFKSGGIYFGIKYAKAKAHANALAIAKEKKQLITQAIELVTNYHITKLNILKLKKQLKINDIEIQNAKELYEAGMVDSLALDDALVKKDQNSLSLLNLEKTLTEIEEAFRKISSKNIKKLKPPKLKLLSEKEFLAKNIDISLAQANTKTLRYLYKMTRSQYLPTVSVGGSYNKITPPALGTNSNFKNYYLRVSMPLNMNAKNDIQRAKLNYLIQKIDTKHSFTDAKAFYKSIKKKVRIYNRQIALSNKELRIYKRLVDSTKRLFKAGQRSKYDVETMQLSYQIKKLDKSIYKLDKELEILKLYKVMQ